MADSTTIRAISLHQPYASLIALGLKRFETRSWSTKFRGLVAIHAAKRWTKQQRDLLERLIDEGVVPPGTTTPPLGGFVGCAKITDCRWAIETHPSRTERLVGDFGPDRFAWTLENPFPIAFVAARGRQGFWSVDAAELGLSAEEVAA